MSDPYIDLLKKVLTNTLFQSEPDIDGAVHRFIPEFTKHYINAPAISMLPMARMDNLATSSKRACGAAAPAS